MKRKKTTKKKNKNKIGEAKLGGIIVSVNNDHGLVVALKDLRESTLSWTEAKDACTRGLTEASRVQKSKGRGRRYARPYSGVLCAAKHKQKTQVRAALQRRLVCSEAQAEDAGTRGLTKASCVQKSTGQRRRCARPYRDVLCAEKHRQKTLCRKAQAEEIGRAAWRGRVYPCV